MKLHNLRIELDLCSSPAENERAAVRALRAVIWMIEDGRFAGFDVTLHDSNRRPIGTANLSLIDEEVN